MVNRGAIIHVKIAVNLRFSENSIISLMCLQTETVNLIGLRGRYFFRVSSFDVGDAARTKIPSVLRILESGSRGPGRAPAREFQTSSVLGYMS